MELRKTMGDDLWRQQKATTFHCDKETWAGAGRKHVDKGAFLH